MFVLNICFLSLLYLCHRFVWFWMQATPEKSQQFNFAMHGNNQNSCTNKVIYIINDNFSDKFVVDKFVVDAKFSLWCKNLCSQNTVSLLLPRWSISQQGCFYFEHISRTKSTQSGVCFLKQCPKIPPFSCLFYEHWVKGRRAWVAESWRGIWC